MVIFGAAPIVNEMAVKLGDPETEGKVVRFASDSYPHALNNNLFYLVLKPAGIAKEQPASDEKLVPLLDFAANSIIRRGANHLVVIQPGAGLVVPPLSVTPT